MGRETTIVRHPDPAYMEEQYGNLPEGTVINIFEDRIGAKKRGYLLSADRWRKRGLRMVTMSTLLVFGTIFLAMVYPTNPAESLTVNAILFVTTSIFLLSVPLHYFIPAVYEWLASGHCPAPDYSLEYPDGTTDPIPRADAYALGAVPEPGTSFIASEEVVEELGFGGDN